VTDIRNFVEASYTHKFTASRTLQWRTSYDGYRSPGVFHYALENGIEDNRNFFMGDWVSTQVSYRTPISRFGTLTVGSEARFDVRALQRVIDVQPVYQEYLRINKLDRSFAFFAQDEFELTRKWKLALGARFDYSVYRRSFASPRASLIYQPSPRMSYKLLYGRAFRNPTAYELFYDDGGYTAAANPNLRPEKANTFEFDVERKLTRRLNATVALYRYAVNDLLVGTYTAEGVFQAQNADRVRASGLEVEINGRPLPWLDVATGVAIQRAVNLAYNYPLPNSPGQIGKLRLAVPLFSNRFSLAGATRYSGSRQTLAGATLEPRFLTDITVSSMRLTNNFDFQAGLRNLANIKHLDPIALDSRFDAMRLPGRSFFVTVTWRSSDSGL
jgi:iron complex outermembrane receptor protein